MSTPTDFDKELEQIISQTEIRYWNGANSEPPFKKLSQKEAVQAIKQAVDKYVIGEDEIFTAKEADGKNEETDSIISGYMKSSRNWLRSNERQSLWGDK